VAPVNYELLNVGRWLYQKYKYPQQPVEPKLHLIKVKASSALATSFDLLHDAFNILGK
jgi:hypothetical protein